MNFADVRAKLTPPIQRATLIEFVSNGLNVPDMLKATAFVAINGMKQAEVDRIGGLAYEALGYMENKDTEGLKDFLTRCKVPPQFAQVITKYVSDYDKK